MSHLRESFITKQERGDLDVKLSSHRKVVVGANERMVVWGITRAPPDGALKAIIEPSSAMEKTAWGYHSYAWPGYTAQRPQHP